MQDEIDYGPQLASGEYDRRLIELQRSLPAMPTKKQDRAARRSALDLAVDARLGVRFPKERRDALWAIQERVEKRRLRLVFRYLLSRLSPRVFSRSAEGLAEYLMSEYAKVLTPGELQRFFNFRPGERPSLPINVSALKR